MSIIMPEKFEQNFNTPPKEESRAKTRIRRARNKVVATGAMMLATTLPTTDQKIQHNGVPEPIVAGMPNMLPRFPASGKGTTADSSVFMKEHAKTLNKLKKKHIAAKEVTSNNTTSTASKNTKQARIFKKDRNIVVDKKSTTTIDSTYNKRKRLPKISFEDESLPDIDTAIAQRETVSKIDTPVVYADTAFSQRRKQNRVTPTVDSVVVPILNQDTVGRSHTEIPADTIVKINTPATEEDVFQSSVTESDDEPFQLKEKSAADSVVSIDSVNVTPKNTSFDTTSVSNNETSDTSSRAHEDIQRISPQEIKPIKTVIEKNKIHNPKMHLENPTAKYGTGFKIWVDPFISAMNASDNEKAIDRSERHFRKMTSSIDINSEEGRFFRTFRAQEFMHMDEDQVDRFLSAYPTFTHMKHMYNEMQSLMKIDENGGPAGMSIEQYLRRLIAEDAVPASERKLEDLKKHIKKHASIQFEKGKNTLNRIFIAGKDGISEINNFKTTVSPSSAQEVAQVNIPQKSILEKVKEQAVSFKKGFLWLVGLEKRNPDIDEDLEQSEYASSEYNVDDSTTHQHSGTSETLHSAIEAKILYAKLENAVGSAQKKLAQKIEARNLSTDTIGYARRDKEVDLAQSELETAQKNLDDVLEPEA